MKTSIKKLAESLENVIASKSVISYSQRNWNTYAVFECVMNEDGTFNFEKSKTKFAWKGFGLIDINDNKCFNSIEFAIDTTGTELNNEELKALVNIKLKERVELEEINRVNKYKNYQPDGDEEDLDFFGEKFTARKDITDLSRENDGR